MSVGTVAGARVTRRGAKARERRVKACAVSGAVVVTAAGPATRADTKPTARPGRPRLRTRLARLNTPAVRTHLGTVVGVAILVALFWRLGTGVFLDGLRRIDATALVAALGIGLVTTVFSAWRWQLVARGLRIRLPLGRPSPTTTAPCSSTPPSRAASSAMCTGPCGTGRAPVTWAVASVRSCSNARPARSPSPPSVPSCC